MQTDLLIESLERGLELLPACFAGRSREQMSWRPAQGGWSLLEILRHLLDEEVEDFRARVRSTLEDPARPWPRIDPEGWVVERRYQEADCATTLARWKEERAASLAWLRSLDAPAWDNVHAHPVLGDLRAGDVFLSWVVHDHLHMRQVSRRLVEHAKANGAPFSSAYAGE
jgi:hypothetical protein